MTDSYGLLTDLQWQVIQPILNTGARWRQLDLRMVVTAIFYKDRTGCQWRFVPADLPCWQSVAYYFYRWQRLGLVERLNQRVNELDREQAGREVHPSVLSIDSQSVKLGPRICEHRGTDGGKKVNGRKRSIATDTGGRIWAAQVTAANIHDSKSAITMLVQLPGQRLELMVGDKAYNGAFKKACQAAGLRFELGSRPESEKGFVPVSKRWTVERTFAWMAFHRQLAHDFCFNPACHRAWIFMFNISICLKRLTNST